MAVTIVIDKAMSRILRALMKFTSTRGSDLPRLRGPLRRLADRSPTDDQVMLNMRPHTSEHLRTMLYGLPKPKALKLKKDAEKEIYEQIKRCFQQVLKGRVCVAYGAPRHRKVKRKSSQRRQHIKKLTRSKRRSSK